MMDNQRSPSELLPHCLHRLCCYSTTNGVPNLYWCVAAAFLPADVALAAASSAMNLDRFYIHHLDPTFIGGIIAGYKTELIPEVRVVGGGVEPPQICIRGGNGKEFRSVHCLVGIFALRYDYPPASALAGLPASWGNSATPLGLWAAWSDKMGVRSYVPINRPVMAETVLPQGDDTFQRTWLNGRNNFPVDIVVGTYGNVFGHRPGRFAQSDHTVRSPVRRKAIDGSEYDASPMEVKRNGAPWYTHFWGYRLGLVANVGTFNAAPERALVPEWNPDGYPSPANNFELAFLPAPVIEDDVVEYVNKPDFPKQPSGQFFMPCSHPTKQRLTPCPCGSAPATRSKAVATFRLAVFTAARTVGRTLISTARTTRNAQHSRQFPRCRTRSKPSR